MYFMNMKHPETTDPEAGQVRFRSFPAFAPLILAFACSFMIFFFSGCSFGPFGSAAAAPTPVPTEAPTPTPVRYESGLGKVVISELMSKNKATVRDADGSFPDWVEIQNITGEDINLYDWCLTDGSAEWYFPDFTLYSNSLAVVYLSKKDRADTELHASFSVSEGDTVSLLDRNREIVDSCCIEKDKSDRSLVRDSSGAWTECLYPTPGYENTASGYEYFCASREAAGPLVINEVCVENNTDYDTQTIGFTDWVEIRNISGETVDLSGYYLSDDAGDLKQYNLKGTLQAGSTTVVLCDKDAAKYTGERMMAPFSLNSENDRLYLSNAEGTLADWTVLQGIPCEKTFGRVEGRNGFFYLEEKTPDKPNSGGCRRVSDKPLASASAVAKTGAEPAGSAAAAYPAVDGVYNGVTSVTVELSAPGEIYYTTDCSEPTTASEKYTGPITLTHTSVIRAISVEADALPSSALTLNYIINENHELPVASLVCGSPRFRVIYANGIKEEELPASLSFYEEDGSFTAGCGVKLNGASSLVLPKKNLSVRFRGSYGADSLDYDLYGGGVTSFTNLVLRAGQDQNNTIVRNEACYTLAAEFTDAVLVPRYRYCVLYLNGVYNGIYTVMEKPNEAFAASTEGVSKDSIEMLESNVYSNDSLYKDVFAYIYENSMSSEENYAHICELLDVDSLIDWTLVQGFLANYDLASGNLRYVRSDENDGKWRLVYYDLDCAFSSVGFIMNNVLTFDNQPSTLNRMLLKNSAYRQRMLERASEGFRTVLTQAHMEELIDSLCTVVESEVERDSTVAGMKPDAWKGHVASLKTLLEENNWEQTAIDNLCSLLSVTPEERELYFGDR